MPRLVRLWPGNLIVWAPLEELPPLSVARVKFVVYFSDVIPAKPAQRARTRIQGIARVLESRSPLTARRDKLHWNTACAASALMEMKALPSPSPPGYPLGAERVGGEEA